MTKLAQQLSDTRYQQLSDVLDQVPDCFEKYPELLAKLHIGEEKSSNVSSLLQRQILVLRKQLAEQKVAHKQLVVNAKHYESTSDKLLALSGKLAACQHWQQVVHCITHDLADLFEIPASHLCLNTLAPNKTSIPPTSNNHRFYVCSEKLLQQSHYQFIFQRIRQGRSFCSERLPDNIMQWFFPDETNDQQTVYQSAAFIPLMNYRKDKKISSQPCLGLLALGVPDQRFAASNKGTVHLDRLGKLLALNLHRFYQV